MSDSDARAGDSGAPVGADFRVGADLDEQYNPRLRVPDFAAIFDRWKTSARRAREDTEVWRDIPYGPTVAEKLDFFPSGRDRSPLLVFLHGGYWRALDKDDFSWIALPYVQAGVSVAVVNYGLMPATPLAEIVHQARRACVWLHGEAERLKVRSDAMFCSGHSAGGHLTAMMFATDWQAIDSRLPRRLLAGGITLSGLFDLEPLTRAPFLRGDLRLDVSGARRLSPAHLPLLNEAPVLRVVGALETEEFYRQSAMLERAWPDVCRTALMAAPGQNHMTVCEFFADPQSEVFAATRSLIG
jgi:arylformamidase